MGKRIDVVVKKEKPKLEKVVKKAIRGMLDKFSAWHFMPMQTMGQSGIPDHIACVPLVITSEMVGETVGVFVGIEAKALGKKPTPLQLHQLEGIEKAGGLSMYIHGTPHEPGNFKATQVFFEKTFNAS